MKITLQVELIQFPDVCYPALHILYMYFYTILTGCLPILRYSHLV